MMNHEVFNKEKNSTTTCKFNSCWRRKKSGGILIVPGWSHENSKLWQSKNVKCVNHVLRGALSSDAGAKTYRSTLTISIFMSNPQKGASQTFRSFHEHFHVLKFNIFSQQAVKVWAKNSLHIACIDSHDTADKTSIFLKQECFKSKCHKISAIWLKC